MLEYITDNIYLSLVIVVIIIYLIYYSYTNSSKSNFADLSDKIYGVPRNTGLLSVRDKTKAGLRALDG